MPSWRTVLIDVPARITEVGLTWYRLYTLALLWAAATVPLAVLLASLVLWYGYGIRWGW